MFHPLLKAALRFFCISILLILPAKIASACSCPPRPNVLEAYEAADEVLIVRVLSVKAVDETSGVRPYIESRLPTVRVERVYKGRSVINDQLVFGQGFDINCVEGFNDESVGKQYLLYMKTPETPGDPWYVNFCGRSNKLEYVREDLLYLDNQQKLHGKTRVSGMILGTQQSEFNPANQKIRIIGAQKTYEIYTDETGVFEIYGLPPGNYRIEAEIAAGWKFYAWAPRSTTRITPPESGAFTLEAKKHASINMMFSPDSYIEGRILSTNGNPVPNVCATLWKPDQTDGLSYSACTDKKGRFEFFSVLPGTYVLVLNRGDEPNSTEPFRRLFYPGTADREKAALIDVDAGQKVRGINMVVPLLETVTVEGLLLFSNDAPAGNQKVRFVPATTNSVNGIAETETDGKGRFSFRVIKGLTGTVISETYIFAGIFGNCPAVDALVKDSPEKHAEIKTPAVRIEAEHDIRNLVLRFPFPRCKSKD